MTIKENPRILFIIHILSLSSSFSTFIIHFPTFRVTVLGIHHTVFHITILNETPSPDQSLILILSLYFLQPPSCYGQTFTSANTLMQRFAIGQPSGETGLDIQLKILPFERKCLN